MGVLFQIKVTYITQMKYQWQQNTHYPKGDTFSEHIFSKHLIGSQPIREGRSLNNGSEKRG